MATEILIADSDKLIQEEFERIFEMTHYHPLFVDNDEEALLRGRLLKPDLIIGGKALCQAVRMDQELKHTPFILLLDLFDDISEKEQKRLGANGMISRPLNEEDVLQMVKDLSQEETEEGEKKVFPEETQRWKSFADMGKSELLSLDELGETEEEIIELVDVVEEPESRMSIEDFTFQQKEEALGDITPIESWGKLEAEEETVGKEFGLPPEEKGGEQIETSLQIEEEAFSKKVSPEEELFEKIELEEILRKVERLQPSIEKEWPVEKEEKILEVSRKKEDRIAGLDEFEAALKSEVKPEPTETGLQPIFFEELKKEEPPVVSPTEAPVETLKLQELAEEEFPEIFLEELTDELEKLEEEELLPEQKAVELESEPIEEEIEELLGEEIQAPEQVLQKTVSVEKPPLSEEIFPKEEPIPIEEAVGMEELKEEELPVAPPKVIPEVSPPLIRLDRTIEEVMTREVQEMMQDFATRIIPKLTKQMITMTMERIEAMVKGIVPDLAEKAIREELERLQKEEKD